MVTEGAGTCESCRGHGTGRELHEDPVRKAVSTKGALARKLHRSLVLTAYDANLCFRHYYKMSQGGLSTCREELQSEEMFQRIKTIRRVLVGETLLGPEVVEIQLMKGC